MSNQEALDYLKNMTKEEAFGAGCILAWENYHNGPIFLCQTECRQDKGGAKHNPTTINFANQALLNYLDAYERMTIHQNITVDPKEAKEGWYTRNPEDVLEVLQHLNDMIEPGSDESQGLSEEQQLALADIRTLIQRFAIPELKRIFSNK